MIKIFTTLTLLLLLINNTFALSKNTFHSKVEAPSINGSLDGSYSEESDVSIVEIFISNSNSCSPPNGYAKIYGITKDGVIEDISNFSITWYDNYFNVIFSGHVISNMTPGSYTVSAIHRESGIASDPYVLFIYATPHYGINI